MTMGKKRPLALLLLTAAMVVLATMAFPAWFGLSAALGWRIFAALSWYAALGLWPIFVNFALEKRTGAGLGFSAKGIFAQFGTGLLLFAVLSAVFIGLPLLLGAGFSSVLPPKDSLLVFALPYRFFFVGFGEEILFRGYFLTRLAEATKSKLWGVALSSVLFGAWHFILGGDIFQVLVTGVIGFALGAARVSLPNTTTLSVSVAHGLYGSFLVLLSWWLH